MQNGWNLQGTSINPINQIHSHHPSHSHQLHISQSNIAPRPNVPLVLDHDGEVCDQTAMLTATNSTLLELN
jgi:hypothetical protein